MRLKVVGDGTIERTRLVNADTGETVDGVIGLSFDLGVASHLAQMGVAPRDDKNEPITGEGIVTIRLWNVPIEIGTWWERNAKDA